MIFFFDAKGNLTRALPETIKQGSNRSSRLWFFMPTSSTNLVNVHFVLPNGEHTEPLPMTSIGYVPIQPNVDYDKTSYSVWFLDIPKRITQYAGVINISFDIASPNTEFDDDNESEVVESVQVEVVRGIVKPLSPTTENTYAELKSYLAGLQTYVGNLIQGLPDFSIYQEKTDESLNTDAKTIVEAINELLLKLETLDKLTYKVVDTLPTKGETNTIYLVPNTNSQDKNIKDEYLWVDNKWELIGSTAIDLTDYQQKTDNRLETESKEIVGAINEVNSKVGQGGTNGVQDVQDTNGNSFVENGVAKIPMAEKLDKKTPTADSVYASTKSKGDILIRVSNTDNGVAIYNNQDLGILPASETEIANKKLARKPICTTKLDYAVKVGLTTNTIPLTDTEQQTACKWLGTQKSKHYYIDLSMYNSIGFAGGEWGGFIEIGITKFFGSTTPYLAPITVFVYDEETGEEREEKRVGLYLGDYYGTNFGEIPYSHTVEVVSWGNCGNIAILSTSDEACAMGITNVYDQITFLLYGEWETWKLDWVFDYLLPINPDNWAWQDEFGNPLDKIPFYEG